MSTHPQVRPDGEPCLDVAHFVQSKVWQLRLPRPPERCQMREEFGVQEPLLESSLGDSEQKEEERSQHQTL